jgi:hypothetical protein
MLTSIENSSINIFQSPLEDEDENSKWAGNRPTVASAMKCPKCGARLIAKPVPGAMQFPRRLECPEHGWQQEKLRPIRMRFHKDRPNW